MNVDYGQPLEFFNAEALGGPSHDVTELNPHGPPHFFTGLAPRVRMRMWRASPR
jgi:hypothetical protein